MPQQITTVVFDVGAVLLDWNPRHLYRKLLADDAAVERFLDTICTTDWNVQQDLGRSWGDAVRELTARHPDHAALIRAYDERWMEMVPGPIPGSPDILEELAAADVPLYAITNFSSEKFQESLDRFDFFKKFKGIVVSGDEKLIKPDPAIYKLFFERYDVAPESAVFIDDSPKNVAGSEAVGMRAHNFTTAELLRAELVDLGFPVRP